LDSQDRTVSIGFPAQDIEDRVCRVKQIGLDNENMITNIRQRGKRDGDKNAGAGSLGQEAWAGSLGQEAWAGQLGQDSQRRQSGWYRQAK
jgi:hypothetical protein